MQVRQAALGGFIAATLVFAGGASPVTQSGTRVSSVGVVTQLRQPVETVFEELHNWRNAALDVVFDVFGAAIAAAKQL